MVTVLAFIVLGGGAYAASQLPKNSVGSKQIRKGSIKPSDLSAKAKRALSGRNGPIGPAGPTGPAGSVGAQGVPGLPAAPGASDVFVATNAAGATIGCCTRTTVLTTAVPAGPGPYLLVFSGTFASPPPSRGYAVHLYLDNGGPDLASTTVVSENEYVAAFDTVSDLSSANQIAVEMQLSDSDQELSYAPGALELIATKAGAVHK